MPCTVRSCDRVRHLSGARGHVSRPAPATCDGDVYAGRETAGNTAAEARRRQVGRRNQYRANSPKILVPPALLLGVVGTFKETMVRGR